jgi:hypothetical protein
MKICSGRQCSHQIKYSMLGMTNIDRPTGRLTYVRSHVTLSRAVVYVMKRSIQVKFAAILKSFADSTGGMNLVLAHPRPPALLCRRGLKPRVHSAGTFIYVMSAVRACICCVYASTVSIARAYMCTIAENHWLLQQMYCAKSFPVFQFHS